MESNVLQFVKDAAIAGTCWGSCAVGVEEMRNVSARRVASSAAIGAIFGNVLFDIPIQSLGCHFDHMISSRSKDADVKKTFWIAGSSSISG